MLYLIVHLLCAIIAMVIQKHDSCLDVGFFALFLITGPIGLVAKIVSKIVWKEIYLWVITESIIWKIEKSI